MKLPAVVQALQAIAPLELAADWDNVGLLLEPRATHDVRTILLTIDLTPAVLEEALSRKAELIVAYHPPIFSGIKSIGQQRASERTVIDVIRHGIAVYSPHTALDAAAHGLNDWLADGVGKGKRTALVPFAVEARRRSDPDSVGQGRRVQLSRPVSLVSLVARVKRHLGLAQLRVATPGGETNRKISSVALCAGAGGSVLSGVAADVWLTGEMRHHDVLAAVEAGTSVILTEHTNSERGYLPHLARRLAKALAAGIPSKDRVEVSVSLKDVEPLRFV